MLLPKTRALARILVAAERLFCERGFDGASIADIAREAGVSKANVFHHFAGKQALYERVLADACAALEESVASTLKRDEEASPASRIEHAIAGCRDALRAQPSIARLALHELARAGRSEAGMLAIVLDRLREDFGAELRRARDCGELRVDADPDAAAVMLLGVLLVGGPIEAARIATRDDRASAPIDALLDSVLRARVAQVAG